MKYEITSGCRGNCFAVPREICGPILEKAGGLSLKALLLLLSGEGESAELSRRLGCSEEELAKALDFWVDCGLFSRCAGKFSPASSLVSEGQPAAPSNAAPDKLPLMSSAEAAAELRTNEELKFLLDQTADVFGRLLSQNEITHIISIIEYTGIAPDAMLMLIQYCAQNDRKSLTYIKRVASDWASRGITTHEAVNAEIMRLCERDTAAETVKRVFQISGRALGDAEKSYAAKWLGELGFDEKMLGLAYETCVLNTGKCDFRYIDRVLGSWKALGIDTPEKASENIGGKKKKAAAASQQEIGDFTKYAVRKHSVK